jgi:hypothetical protein
MLRDAEKLRAFLISLGYSVFLCSESLEAGVAYRNQICENAEKCLVFVAFINQGWCKSAECDWEFNIALAHSLKSNTRTPYIIPILLEEFAFYSDYPTVNGLTKNAMGIVAKPEELGEGIWAKVLKTIKVRSIEPSNPPPPPSPSRNTPNTTPPTPAPVSPSMKDARVPLRGPIRNPPPKPEPQQTKPPSRPHVAPPEWDPLIKTALQLITEVCAIEIGGSSQLKEILENAAKSTLEGAIPTEEGVSGLRALMDYLSKLKEIASEGQFTAHKLFPDVLRAEDTLKKLVAVVLAPLDAIHPAGEFFRDKGAGQFWEINFRQTTYSVKWQQFEDALRSNAAFKLVADADSDIMQDLQLCLDHYNTGYVVCHRLSDFVGTDSLKDALQKYQNKKALNRSGPLSPPPADAAFHFPALLWIDDNPGNNEYMCVYAKELGICVINLESTTAAKQWLTRHSKVLEVKDVNQVHIITDNVRTGASTVLDLNAGEDIIRFVRGRRSVVPILVYCGNLLYAQYVKKYKNCKASIEGEECQQFIEELSTIKQ